MIKEQRHTFGFEGIWQGTAVLYDHQTKSLWYHLSGKCFDGPLAGMALPRIASGRHTTWREWTRAHPDTDVIAQETKYVGRLADQGYFRRDASYSGSGYLPGFFNDTISTRDRRLIENELLYGIVVNGKARAYPLAALRERPVVEETFESVPVTVWFKEEGRTVTAFDRRVRGEALSFAVTADGRAKDRETGSVWTFEGQCIAGPHRGRALRAVHGLLAEWYGWYAHYRETTIYGR